MRNKIIYIVIIISVFTGVLYGQNSISPRSIAMGGILGLVKEPFSIYLNPAGLSGVEDFYIAAGTNILEKEGYPSFFAGAVLPLEKNFTFGVGWRHLYSEKIYILETEYKLSKFYSAKNRTDENDFFFTGSLDISQKSSLGFVLNFKNRYIKRDSIYYSNINLSKHSFNSSTDINEISLQLGFQYQIVPKVRLGLLTGALLGVKNINLRINDDVYKDTDFFSSMDRKLTDSIAKFGLAYFINNNLILLSDLNLTSPQSENSFFQTGGFEYSLKDMLFFRVSSMLNYNTSNNFFKNIKGGVGFQYKGFRLDYCFNQYEQYQLGLSYSPEMINRLVKIVQIAKIDDNIYPMLYSKYLDLPIAYVKVFNSSSKKLRVKATFEMDEYLSGSNETNYYDINPKQIVSIPVYANFNKKINDVKDIELNEGIIKLYSDDRGSYQDKSSVRFVFHEKHNWSGKPEDLVYYLTPSAFEIVNWSRNVLNSKNSSFSVNKDKLSKFYQAKALINELSNFISYVNDPESAKMWSDKVQFPVETMNIGSGDCEDLVVLISSVLNAVGISTAFVDIDYSSEFGNYAHIYLLFDTEIPENDRNLVSSNEKRYIIRKSKNGIRTVWLPLETTQIEKGFNKVWEEGALNFYNDYNIRLGKVKDWMKIIDVNNK